MLALHLPGHICSPLDEITVTGAATGRIAVRDGLGRQYLDLPAAEGLRFRVGGALGAQTVFHCDDEGRLLDSAAFRVRAQTAIDDGGRFKALFDDLYYTLITCFGGRQHKRLGGKFYQHFVSWLRDHTHTMKGMKWFEDGLKTGFELYAERQRADGMIWDRCYPAGPEQSWRDYTFRLGDFIAEPEDGIGFQRIPVENDVEWLFLECLYFTWKATGDDAWMAGWLDSALKALRYGTSDEYRWSEQYQLLKRGYTIDTWDFVSQYDGPDATDDNGIRLGHNVVIPGKSSFGVFHGDNTGMAQGCLYLAEMLRVAGREAEADQVEATGRGLQERLDALSWNGRFYTHWVEEEPKRERDFGVDPESQVTLSNAYALNRAITHQQAVAIIDSYQRIREEMPASSAGEWYNCYPPFERGFKGKWDYMNGGVCSITAGELARGAFHHGREGYGCDILGRLCDHAANHGGRLPVVLKGALPEEPQITYTPVDLGAVANVDIRGEADSPAIAWSGDGPNDLRNLPTGAQRFGHVDYRVLDPAANEGAAAVGISRSAPYAQEIDIPVGAKAASLWFLHTLIGGGMGGLITAVYDDGSEASAYVQSGANIGSWFMPGGNADVNTNEGAKSQKPFQLAWRGGNAVFDNVGVWHWGWNNPHPEKTIARLRLRAPEAGSATWMVLGISLADHAAWWPTDDVSSGIPNNWGAGAVVYALIEGLAGIVDRGTCFSRIELKPRWSAAGVSEASACAHYPDSDAYCSYRYTRDAQGISLQVAATGEAYEAALLLPEGFAPTTLTIDGADQPLTIDTIEDSRYLRLPIHGLHAHDLRIEG